MSFLSTNQTKLTIEEIIRTKINSACNITGEEVGGNILRIPTNIYYKSDTDQVYISSINIETSSGKSSYQMGTMVATSKWKILKVNSSNPSNGYIVTKI